MTTGETSTYTFNLVSDKIKAGAVLKIIFPSGPGISNAQCVGISLI